MCPCVSLPESRRGANVLYSTINVAGAEDWVSFSQRCYGTWQMGKWIIFISIEFGA